MAIIQIDPLAWIPDGLKRQILDGLIDFVAGQAESILGNQAAEVVKKLRSDADFVGAFNVGLKKATERFVEEYTSVDEDLVAVIVQDANFWKTESVRQALQKMIRRPGAYLVKERETIVEHFADVLPQRINRERVDRAVIFFLRCLAEELWYLPQVKPVYELQLQRVTAERATEMVQELQWMREDVCGVLVALVETMAERQKLLPGSGAVALPTPKKVYHNLPQPDYGTFVGREAELVKVCELLSPDSRHFLVTIDGIGGIGKSALALETAHHYLREYDTLSEEERFEAIIWTSAKAAVLTADGIAPRQRITRTLGDIYTTISVVLECEDITRARTEEQDEIVMRALTRQRTLLIVDNLETVDDERVNAFLRDLPAPTKAIVTTRHRLDVAYPVRLTGMPEEDGLALIAQECGRKGVTLTEEEAHKLYDRTGGVPLAIVWSVAQMGYGYGVEAALRRLGQPTGDIARYCFEGSVERIRGTDTHKLLMALSLFATDASREALGYVAGLGDDVLSRDEGLVTLERLSLVNKRGEWLSLVNKRRERFWVLPLTKTYATEGDRLGLDEVVRLRYAYADYFLHCAEEHSSRSGEDLVALEIEHDNIREAINWCKDQEAEHIRRMLPGFATALHEFHWLHGYWNELAECNELAFKVSRMLQDWRQAGHHAYEIGFTRFQQGNFEEADRWGQEAVSAMTQAGDEYHLARVKRLPAMVARVRGDYQTSKQLLDEMLASGGKLLETVESDEEARKIKDNLLVDALTTLANLERDVAKNYSEARRLYEESLAINRELDNTEKIGLNLNHLGSVDLAEYDQARRSDQDDRAKHYLALADEHFTDGRKASEKVPRADQILIGMYGQARVAEKRGKYAQARELAQEALKLYRYCGAAEMAEVQEFLDRIA